MDSYKEDLSGYERIKEKLDTLKDAMSEFREREKALYSVHYKDMVPAIMRMK